MRELSPWDEVQLELFPESYAREDRALRPTSREAWPRAASVSEDAPAAAPVDALDRALDRAALADGIRVAYTLGRGKIVAVEPDEDTDLPVLRAQACFKAAPDEIADAVVRLYFSRLPRGERARLSQRVMAWHTDHAPAPCLSKARYSEGQVHRLNPLLSEINEAWFDGELDLEIGFSPRRTRRLMGRHERRDPRNLVLVNPLLDHAEIERWYVAFLVFHECLHEAIPPRWSKGRLMIHPPEFRAIERAHPDWPEVKAYERWITEDFWERSQAVAAVAR